MQINECDITSDDGYRRCINNSKKVSWEIDKDVIRGRQLNRDKRFLPDGLTGINKLDFLDINDQILLSQIQGRTYANMFGLVERFINTKILDLQKNYFFGSKVSREALGRFSDEEIKHQELFRRIEEMAAHKMPEGYQFPHDPNEVASVVLEKSTWSVLALTSVIELFTQSHYLHSIEKEQDICPLFKDVFLFHWREESQHAVLDELEWRRLDKRLPHSTREGEVNDLIQLVVAVDGILQAQAEYDSQYFLDTCGKSFYEENQLKIEEAMLEAYRYQYIFSGTSLPHFQEILGDLLPSQQLECIATALGTLQPINPILDWNKLLAA